MAGLVCPEPKLIVLLLLIGAVVVLSHLGRRQMTTRRKARECRPTSGSLS